MSQEQIDKRRLIRKALKQERARIERLEEERKKKEAEERIKKVKGFKPIAVRDDRLGNTVISLNPSTKEFLFAVSGKVAGPFSLTELKALRENLTDVIEMQGCYLFIKEYNAYGDRTG